MDGAARPSPVELVRRHGGVISHAALEPGCSTYREAEREGLLAFRLMGRCAVAYGDPVCPPELLGSFIDGFRDHCEAHGWSALYVAASRPSVDHGTAHGHAAIEFAQLLLADPQHDPEAGHEARHLRQKCSRVRRAGVEVHPYPRASAPDPALEAAILDAVERWLGARRGPQVYLGRPRWFADPVGHQWLYATHAGRVVGALSLLEVSPAAGGTLINHVLATPDAPSGTTELLVVAALRSLREARAARVCLGLTPLPSLGEIVGLRPGAARVAGAIYRGLSRATHLEGKREFWDKFGLAETRPLYLLFHPPRFGLRPLLALVRAFHLSWA